MEQVLWNIYSTCMTFVPPLRGTFIIGTVNDIVKVLKYQVISYANLLYNKSSC